MGLGCLLQLDSNRPPRGEARTAVAQKLHEGSGWAPFVRLILGQAAYFV